jgi:hypothetical protein
VATLSAIDYGGCFYAIICILIAGRRKKEKEIG